MHGVKTNPVDSGSLDAFGKSAPALSIMATKNALFAFESHSRPL